MPLDTQGIISAVTLAIHVPIFFFAFCISSRYGVKERGWLLLAIFSLIRIAGSAFLVAAKLMEPVKTATGLYIGSNALDASCLSLLLLSTLGLLEIITEGPGRKNIYSLIFRNFLHVVGIVALVLVIIGLSDLNSGNSDTERCVGVLFFAGLYISLIAVTVMQWPNRQRLMKHRKQLLIAVSAALPFLAVRTLYSVLSILSSDPVFTGGTITFDPNSPLTKFNMSWPGGEWQLYVVMDVVMEYAIVVIYILAGTMLRLDQDYELQETDEYPLYRRKS